MNPLKRYPFVRLLIPYLAGIILVLFFPNLPNISWFFLAVLFIALLLFAFSKSTLQRFHYEWVFGVLLYLLLFMFGWQRCYQRQHFIDTDHFSNKDSSNAWIAFVEEEPAEKARSWKTTLTMSYVRTDGKWTTASGSLIAYFAKDSMQSLPKTGECLIFFTRPDSIPPTLNPYAFDYSNYLHKKGIAHRVYLYPDSWQLVDTKAPFDVSRLALQVRSKILHILEKSPLTENEFGVAAAILLGYDDKLDSDLRQTYSDSGAAHILCVSGMHVGVVFLIINTLLAFLNRKKHGNIIKACLLFLFIWSYAFITGLSAAVLRATIMISFVVFANAFKRPKEIWNTIAASAFFLLIANPNLLSDIGFQLSYAAVIAIIALQPKISQLIQVPTWLGRNIWDLIAVSIAAQIGTAPLSIFYFHQFPSWFILTNLIVMPFSTLIIYSGVAMLLLSFIPFMKTLLGGLLFYEIRILNLSMVWISNLPGAVIENINLLSFEAAIAYIIIIAFVVFCIQKSAKSLYVTLFAILAFLCCLSIKHYQHSNQTEMVAFEAGKSPAIGFVNGEKMVLITDSALMHNPDQQSFIINGYQVRKGIRDITFVPEKQSYSDSSLGLFIHHQFTWFQNTRLTIIDQRESSETPTFKSDYLLIREGRYGQPEDYLLSYDCKNIIVDGSNTRWMLQQWHRQRDSMIRNVQILPQEGALVKQL